MAEASLSPDIKSTIKLPSIIRDGLQHFCTSIEYSYLREMSDIGEFCEGIHITGFTYQVIGRAPIRQNSDIARNYARHAVQIKERTKSARDLLRKAAQGITAKLRPGNVPVVEIGGTLDARNEVRDNRTFERNRDYVLPPGVMQAQQEDHYMVIAKYHVTLVAQANRTIKVLSTRALAAGGIGAAGGGVTGAAAGAGAGATAGGIVGMIGTPIGAAIGAGVGALIGGGVGLVAGLAGGAGAGVGVAHRVRPIMLTCTAEDVFPCLEMSSKFHKEEGRVFVEITGSFECEGSHTQILLQEMEQLQVDNA